MRFVGMGLLCMGLTLTAWGENPPIQGSEAISGMAEDARALSEILSQTTLQYRRVGEPVRAVLSPRGEPAAYHNTLFDLVVRTEANTQSIDFTRWPANLNQLLSSLQQDLQGRTTRTELQDRFFAVHVAYVRTLVATYCFIESAKREYLYADAVYLLSEGYRQDLQQRLNDAHARAHRLMRWMHYIRTAQDLSVLTQSHYFQGEPVWEVTYGANFHYVPNRPLARQAFSRKTELDRYFAPFQASAPANPQNNGNEDEKQRLLKEWEEVQRELEKPENRDNAELRSRLEELQRKLDEAYANPGTSTPQPAPQTPGERNSTNDRKLNQLTIRLQNLLARQDVQQNAELKTALEAFLKELNPEQSGPVKPLPPQEPATPPTPPQESRNSF